MRISVIMASYLEDYVSGPHKSATNRDFKFRRALDSFLNQTFGDAELIVVSDGCKRTSDIINNEYNQCYSIKLIEIPKQEMFSGNVRQTGLNNAKGEIICYLDSDDYFGNNHLAVINKFNDKAYEWCYYDDYLYNGQTSVIRPCKPEHGHIGTSAICHRRNSPFKWENGYGHDWRSIEKIISRKHYKLETPEYMVCHVHGLKIDA